MVDAKDQNGMTALHWAVVMADCRLVGLLLDNGASLKAEDSSGKTALDSAEDKEVIRLLQVS